MVRDSSSQRFGERHSFKRMKRHTNANKPSSLHVDFLGLSVEISERVVRAWKKVPEEKRFRYLERTYDAQKNERESKRPTNLQGEQDEGPLFVCTPTGPGTWKVVHGLGLGVLWSDDIKLIQAWRMGDALALRRMAARLLRGAKPKGREQIKDFLLRHWITPEAAWSPLAPNGICLIWLSVGALEELLRKVGLWDAKKTVKALEARITRLKLPKLPKAIVHLKHLQWCQDKRVVVM